MSPRSLGNETEDSAVIHLNDLMAWPGGSSDLPTFGDRKCRLSAAVRWDTKDGELDVELLDQLGQPVPQDHFENVERKPGLVAFDGPGHSSAIYLRVKNDSNFPIPYHAEIRARNNR